MNKIIQSFVLLTLVLFLFPIQGKSFFLQSQFEVITKFPGPKSIYTEVQRHRMHVSFLDTEICKIQAGKLPNISISEINRRVNLMDERLAYFQEYNNSVEVRKDPNYSLPQNLTVQEATYKFGSELSYLQANLISGRSLNEKKFQKLAEVNREKIHEIEWEMEDYRKNFKVRIDPWDPSDLPAGPNDEEFGFAEEVIAEETPAPEMPEEVEQDTPIEETVANVEEAVVEEVAQPVEEKVEEVKERPVSTLVVVEEETEAVEPVIEVVEEVEVPTVEVPTDNTEVVTITRPKPEETKPDFPSNVVVDDEAESHPIVRTPLPNEGVSGEFKFYREELRSVIEESSGVINAEYRNENERAIALAPVKEKLTLIRKQIEGRIENDATMRYIDEMESEIIAAKLAIQELEKIPIEEPVVEEAVLAEAVSPEIEEAPVVEEVPAAEEVVVASPIETTKIITEVPTFEEEEEAVIPPPVSRTGSTAEAMPIVRRVINSQFIVTGYEKWHFFFDPGQADHRPNQVAQMHEIVELLQHNPHSSAVIKGYTDKSGTTTKNMTLSQRRAESVLDFLLDNGIDADRVQIISMGDSTASKTKDPFARRVEVKLVTAG